MGDVFAVGDTAQPPRTISSVLVTNFDQIWRMSETEAGEWYPFRLEYLVYYYDPLWAAMWGHSGEADSFLSVGATPFPIKAGQRILIEGLIRPANGMRVEEPKVTVLAESVTMEGLPTRGEIGNTQRFNKRLVSVEGYVDRQSVRDANHHELELVVEGRTLSVHFLVKSGEIVPPMKDALVRIQGVYFARNEPNWPVPKLEIWVPGTQAIKVLGQLQRDERFQVSATPIDQLRVAPPEALVRVTGTVQAQQPGKSLTIRDATGGLTTLQTAQTQALTLEDQVEAIGLPRQQDGGWTLDQALYRRALRTLTSFEEAAAVLKPERNDVHRIRFECVVYYFDPYWKVGWGRCAGVDNFMALGVQPFPIKAGQRILVEGLMVPARETDIDEPRVTLLAESVPLEALATRGQIDQTERFNKHLTTVEGFVDRQVRSDSHHLELNLVTEGRSITARVLLEGDAAVPQLEGALVLIRGVYSATVDPSGGPARLEIWVQGTENIGVNGELADDNRFNLPVTAIENLATADAGKLVLVAGAVRGQQPGKSLTIRDETGQLTLLTAQTRAVQLGEQVEAIGFPRPAGPEWRLHESLYRRAQAATHAPASGTPSLRLAEQLRELPPAEAARGYPVQLSGVVTWAHVAADFFFIGDITGGVCVYESPEKNARIAVGARVTVSGVSASGKFTPVVLAASVRVSATVDLPEAKQVTLEQALTGIEEAQWVAMSGYVRAVVREGPWGRLELTTSAGEFAALLPWSEQLASLHHSVVRVRGVCSALTNGRRQLTGIQLWVPSGQYVEILQAEPADPFSVAVQSITSLRQFSSLQASSRRVRVAGAVVSHTPGHRLLIQEGNEGLLVLSRDLAPLVPGDRIEAVGFPGRENSRVVLREAAYRRLAPGAEPAPQAVESLDKINVELDSRLVRLEAVLLDIGAQEKGTRLILQAGSVVFEARLETQKTALPDNWVPGSRLALTGVYQVQFDEYKRPHALELQLRTMQDVRVLSRPTWWTARRALWATGVLTVGIVLGFSWVVALQRQVRRQTGLIREQVESEKAARLEVVMARSSKLESLGVLAGGIAHDFNNLLTVVVGNLSLAKLDPRITPATAECLVEGERAAFRARDLTQQLITFARGGEPVRAVTVLADVLHEATRFALHGAKVRCDFDLAAGAWPADIDRGQIGQVVHNVIINAVQAMPAGGVVRITLVNEELTVGMRPPLAAGRYLRLTIADNGTGISPEILPRIFDPYFSTKERGSGLGLASAYSIVQKHRGQIEVESKLNQGTTFHIWLPAADASARPLSAPPQGEYPPMAGRALVMDDEAAIRKLTSLVLERQGFEVVAVADGAEAVREYGAARAADRPFDLVILDLTVPGGMGGSETIERLRQLDPNVCAIVSSGYSNDPVMASYQAHGFRARISKPYNIGELVKTINVLLPHRLAKNRPFAA